MYVELYMQLSVMLHHPPITFLITSIYPLRDENLGHIELIHISFQFLKLFLVRQGLHAWLSLIEFFKRKICNFLTQPFCS